MASNQVTKEAIHAVQMFTKTGQASKISVVKEIFMGLALGVSMGMLWKTYHWSYIAKLDEYYTTLAKVEGPKIKEQREKYMGVNQ